MQRITRRGFIQTLGSAAALIAAGGTFGAAFGQKKGRDALFPIPVEVYSDPLFSMTAKQFETLLGHLFTVTSEDGEAIQLTLTEVNILDLMENSSRGYYGEVFSLIFEGSKRQTLQQGRYQVIVDGLAAFSALVVPTGRAQRQYEVIINRLGR